jgi:hypothetical protein
MNGYALVFSIAMNRKKVDALQDVSIDKESS